MASNITQFLFRRGSDASRQTIVLQSGEPGFTTDSNRIFVGNGTTSGGISVANINLGYIQQVITGNSLTTAATSRLSAAQIGDTIYELNTNTLYSLTATPNGSPSINQLVPIARNVTLNPSEFTFGSNAYLSLANNAISAAQVSINALDGVTLSKNSDNVLSIGLAGVSNKYLSLAPANSVKGNFTGALSGVTDLSVTSGAGLYQFIGTADSTGLGAIQLYPGNNVSFTTQVSGASAGGVSMTIDVSTGVEQGDGVIINTDQYSNLNAISVNNSIDYLRSSNLRPVNTTYTSVISTLDGSVIGSLFLPYQPNFGSAPAFSFESIARISNPPNITIYWTTSTSGGNNITVFATNSSASTKSTSGSTNPSPTTSRVACAYIDNVNPNLLYIGGNFSKIGSSARYGFAAIDMSQGSSTWNAAVPGNYGALSALPGSSTGATLLNGGSPYGFVNSDNSRHVFQITKCFNYLCVGGYFNTNGAVSLALFDTNNNYYLSAYTFNTYNSTSKTTAAATIYSLVSAGNYLYVAGNFTSIKGPLDSPSSYHTARGLTRIQLNGGNVGAIDTTFTDNIRSNITSNANTNPIYSINLVPSKTQAGEYALYAAGKHSVQYKSAVWCKYLTSHWIGNPTQNDGQLTNFNAIFNNPVNTVHHDTNNNIYVGGSFTSFNNSVGNGTQTPNTLTPLACNNLLAFDSGYQTSGTIDVPRVITSWIPNVNNTIYNIAFHDSAVPGFSAIYLAGSFTKVNNTAAQYAAAITYPTGNTGITVLPWSPRPNTALNYGYGRGNNILRIPITNALSGVVLVGNFTTVVGANRFDYARVTGYNETLVANVSTVNWGLNAGVIGVGGALDVDTSVTATLTSSIGVPLTVNSTIFTPNDYTQLTDINRGDYYRVFIQRPGANQSATGWVDGADTFRDQTIQVIGVGIDYDTGTALGNFLSGNN